MVCPWLNGASNWYSASWNPLTSLYYVQTNDKCGIFTRTDKPFQLGHGYMGGSYSGDPADPGRRVLRAFDIQTGKAFGSCPRPVIRAPGAACSAPPETWSCTGPMTAHLRLRTQKPASRCGASRAGAAHDSPMTYMFDNRQYIPSRWDPVSSPSACRIRLQICRTSYAAENDGRRLTQRFYLKPSVASSAARP